MPVNWTEHRFAGGALALDVTNTVVLRGDLARSFDRFEDAYEISRFADAASRFRREELKSDILAVADPHGVKSHIVDMREATDRLFRNGARSGSLATADLPDFLTACAEGLRSAPVAADLAVEARGQAGRIVPLEAAIALSALALLPEAGRIRICQNCCWLFLDRSRNGSRRWCDMAVCGNRQKAKRHYRRRAGKEAL